jgi:hypothetical protein
MQSDCHFKTSNLEGYFLTAHNHGYFFVCSLTRGDSLVISYKFIYCYIPRQLNVLDLKNLTGNLELGTWNLELGTKKSPVDSKSEFGN